jgi:hypothetical protein
MRKASSSAQSQARPFSTSSEAKKDPSQQFSSTSSRNNCGKARRSYARLRAALKLGTNTLAEKPLQSALLCSRDFLVMVPTYIGGRSYKFVPYTCGKKFCSACAEFTSRELQERLLPLAEKAGTKRLRHLVLTVRNVNKGKLSGALDDLQHCFREWRNQGRRKSHGEFWRDQAGYHAKIEVTYKPGAGWHPHIHVLMDCPKGYDHRDNSPSRNAWERITYGRTGCAAIASWICRAQSASIVREVAKYTVKPLEIESAGSAALCEAAASLHRRRIYTCGGTLKAELEEVQGNAYAYVERLSSIIAAPNSALARGIDVSEIVCQMQRRFRRDQTIRERIPALRGILDDDQENNI